MGRGSRWKHVGRDSVAILPWPSSKWRHFDGREDHEWAAVASLWPDLRERAKCMTFDEV